MKKISGSTFYYKKVFPALWFVFLLFIFIASLVSGVGEESFLILTMPVVMAIFGYMVIKFRFWNLADEVYDYDNYLEFHKDGKTQKVYLNEIVNIEYSRLNAPDRILMHTRTQGPIGGELVFILPIRLIPFTTNPLAYQIIERVNEAKNT
ncbi:MAG: hypothetical protein P8171_17590 [Candidatus Thiodiazotropha sp.]|jgi:hypothetical protein